MKAAFPSLLALILVGAFATAPGAEILVKNGRDADGLEPPPDSLRAAVQNANPGDTIKFASPITVLLEGDLNVPTAGLRFEGPGQIRGKPIREGPDGTTQEFETFNVTADGVTIHDLIFRNCAVNIGVDVGAPLQGATISNCVFKHAGYLQLVNVDHGRVENNRFENSNTLGIDSITLDSTISCVVFDNTIANTGDANISGGVYSLFDEDVRIEMVESNRGFFIQSKSGQILRNTLKTSPLVVDTFQYNATSMLVENNEAKRIFAKGVNLTLRKNKLFPRGHTPIDKEFPNVEPRPEDEVSAALLLRAANEESGVAPGPVLAEENEITGGRVGIQLLAGKGLSQVTLHKNLITETDRQGIVINQFEDMPVMVTENVLTGCGSSELTEGLPIAALHLRLAISTNVVAQQNQINGSHGAGILVDKGSPLVKNNEIKGGKAKGLYLSPQATPTIEGNTIERMSEGGLFLHPEASATVTDITLKENGDAGIILSNGAILRSENATIENNKGPGIVFRAQSIGTVTRGTIHNNKGAGINLVNGAMAEIRSVSFTGNKGPGIDIAPAGVTRNDQAKKANGDIDFPSEFEFDDSARLIRGKAEPGSLVQLYRVEDEPRIGNKENGEGAIFIGETNATGAGDFTIAPGPAQEGDLFTFTATRPGAQPVSSEFSLNFEIPPTPLIEAVSVSSDEVIGNGRSEVAGLNSDSNRTVSDNGRFVLFSSVATNLVGDDTNGLDDIFVRDRMNGTTERANLSSSGGQVTAGSISPHSAYASISGDGRFVAFTCDGGSLVGSPTTDPNVFLRDRQTGTTIAVSQVPDAPPGTDPLRGGRNSSISADGSTVVFTSIHDFVPSNFGYDLFVWRRLTGEFSWVNVAGAGGTNGTINDLTTNPRLSSTGQYVVFSTIRPLVGTDTNGTEDVYLRDVDGGTTELVSVDNNGVAISGGNPSISADGRYVVFSTIATRDPGDINDKTDIYLRDRQTGTLHWVSPPPAGGFGLPNMNRGCSRPSISADGRYVAFQASGSSLRPDSITLLVEDVFVHDRQLGKTVEVSVGTDGLDARGDSIKPTLSGDGRTVVFGSFGNELVPGDTNNADDIFARDISRDFDE